MEASQKTRDDFAECLITKVQTWFENQIEMDNENFIESLLTQEELVARSEVRESCSNFMVEVFAELAQNVEMESAE